MFDTFLTIMLANKNNTALFKIYYTVIRLYIIFKNIFLNLCD